MFGGRAVDLDQAKFEKAIKEVPRLKPVEESPVEWPKREVERYAPPAVREAAAPPPPFTPIEQLAVLCRTLTYGEMMYFAEGIGADPAKINAWATSL